MRMGTLRSAATEGSLPSSERGKFAVHLRFEQNLQITHHHANGGRSRPCGRCVICQPFSCQRTVTPIPSGHSHCFVIPSQARNLLSIRRLCPFRNGKEIKNPALSAGYIRPHPEASGFRTDLRDAHCLLTRYPWLPSRIPESTPHPPSRMFGQSRSRGTFPENVKPLRYPFF